MIKKLCIFTFSYSANRHVMLKYLEKVLPKDVEIFLFTTKNHKKSYHLSRIKIVDTQCTKQSSFIELRRFCKSNNIERVISLGLLPYEELVLFYSTILSKTDFLYFNLGNPIEGFKVGPLYLRLISILEIILSIKLSPFPKKIILPSKDITRIVKKYLIFARKKIFYLPPTLSTKLFVPKNKVLARRKIGIGKEEKVVIFVGRIGLLKGSDILKYVIEQNPDIKFLVIGNLVDKNFNGFKARNLIFLPPKKLEDLVDYYNAADLCFFPTRIEGLPLVPREAMSCGTPVIISDILTSRSILPAIKVPLNKKKMDLAIKHFFNLPLPERKKLSEKSRRFITNEYDDDIWKKEYSDKILT